MNTITPIDTATAQARTAADVARELGPIFAQRAAETTDEDQFVADNFALLKSSGPGRTPACRKSSAARRDHRRARRDAADARHHCPSTALAFSMHTHQVAIPAWRWTHQKVAAVEPLLKRIAAERIVLLVERRLRLDRGLGQGREGRGRLQDHRAKDLLVRLAGR